MIKIEATIAKQSYLSKRTKDQCDLREFNKVWFCNIGNI